MEEKLFLIGIGIGVYALALRGACRLRDMATRGWTLLWHGLFCAMAGAVLFGFLGSMFHPSAEPFEFALYGILPGLALGIIWILWKRKDPMRILQYDLEWADTAFSAILLAAFIMYFFVQAFKIPSGSMRETFIEGDHLFVNKFIYGTRIPFMHQKILRWKDVSRGDVVVFRFPSEDKKVEHYGKDFIKRAIGLPGDTVEIKSKTVLINGKALTEDYVQYLEHIIESPWPRSLPPNEYQQVWMNGRLPSMLGSTVRDNFGPIVIPKEHYFVMGDNRDHSYDSRFWGPLPDSYLKGKAWVLYWPIRRIKKVH